VLNADDSGDHVGQLPFLVIESPDFPVEGEAHGSFVRVELVFSSAIAHRIGAFVGSAMVVN